LRPRAPKRDVNELLEHAGQVKIINKFNIGFRLVTYVIKEIKKRFKIGDEILN
jgi:hypothetical protein